jgi:hypothetical protein
MADKKAENKKTTRSRFTVATRLLGSELRATLQTPPAEEPWRPKIPKGKGSGKRKK